MQNDLIMGWEYSRIEINALETNYVALEKFFTDFIALAILYCITIIISKLNAVQYSKRQIF